MKKNILIFTILALIFSLSASTLLAQGSKAAPGNGKQKNSPFLIVGKLPHLTKLLMKQWDNPELNLSAAQKTELLVVRKETITGVKSLGKKIFPLEKQVADGIFAGQTPDELSSLVANLASLKAEATMIHLRCIYATNKILDQQQMEFLEGL